MQLHNKHMTKQKTKEKKEKKKKIQNITQTNYLHESNNVMLILADQ